MLVGNVVISDRECRGLRKSVNVVWLSSSHCEVLEKSEEKLSLKPKSLQFKLEVNLGFAECILRQIKYIFDISNFTYAALKKIKDSYLFTKFT